MLLSKKIIVMIRCRFSMFFFFYFFFVFLGTWLIKVYSFLFLFNRSI